MHAAHAVDCGMANTRTQILREPGHIIVSAANNPATYFSEAPIQAELFEEVVALPSARFGELDQIPVGRLIKVKFIPQEVSAGAIAALYPFGSKPRGGSLLAATDVTLDIHTITGKRCRIPNAFVYKEPEIRGDVRKTPFGECEWWGIVPLNGSAGDVNSFWEETAVAYPGDDLFNTAEVKPLAWQVAWGAAPWDDIDLADSGFSIKPQPKLIEDKCNGYGVINVALAEYGVDVEFEALNIPRSAVVARAGFGTALGGRKSDVAHDFVATAAGLVVTASHAHLVPGSGFQFGSEPRAVGKLKLATSRKFANGAEVSPLIVTIPA